VNVLLLHPPLLSAGVWRRVAPFLREAGHEVAAPPLTFTRVDRWWQEASLAAVAAMSDADAVVAHSGGGVLVPLVVDVLPAVVAVVLVDAVLPAERGLTTPSAAIRDHVRTLAVDEVLPPWTSWWPEDELAAAVPDPDDRRILAGQAPALPASFYDYAVPAPEGWEPAHRVYLQLSPAYASAADQASQRGWQVVRRPGRHLDLLNEPADTAQLIVEALRPVTDISNQEPKESR
jgi:hypothetical protein